MAVIAGFGNDSEAIMARNAVQFQRGLSTAQFQALYGTEEQCHAALVVMRWPEGFVCPKCQGKAHAFCKPKRLFQCSACRVQTSARAGTIFHKSRTPLSKWFLAMHLLTSAKNDISALELARQLDVKWDTAWLIKQKLMEVMFQRNSTYRLAGDVQIDDAYQGGERPVNSAGNARGSSNKMPFILAVETREGKPVYTHIRCVPAFTQEAIRTYAAASLSPGARVRSDGLKAFMGIADAGLTHLPKVTGGGRPADPDFKWVNTALGNIKSSITGTCRSCARRHLPRYLAAYEWRFNRRFDLAKNLTRLGRVATTTKPKPYRQIAPARVQSAETYG
jgi:ISXO2-like transposase domain/Transposase zinc-ribbon domain